MSDEGNVYTVQQAARVLRVSSQRVHTLIGENKLEACRDEGTGDWLINARSVHARLEELPPEPPEARGERVHTREGSRADLWVLLFIAAITLLAAGYTLYTALSGG